MPEPLETLQAARPRRFRPYPEMKSSGVEWLGEIPVHWETPPVYAKYEVELVKMLDSKRVTGHRSRPYLRNTDVQWDYINAENLPTMDFLPSEEARYRLRAGDLLVCEGGEVGRTAIWKEPIKECFYQKALHRVRPKHRNANARHFYYTMRTAASSEVFSASGNQNTIDHLTATQLRHYRIPYPPASEQDAITTFLDRETAKIDALVAKKKRLIELLQEKRTALITRAVTRGLAPGVPMKDSGVEWLGEIPAHWEVKPLKALSKLQTGVTLGKRYEGEIMEPRAYLRVANVQDGFLDLEDVTYLDLPVSETRRYELQRGDVLMTEGGDFDKLGRGYIWDGQIPGCLHQNHIFAVRPRQRELKSKFLSSVMRSVYGRAYFTATSKQSTNLASTNSTKIRNFPLPLPPTPEQDAILERIDRECARVDALTTKIREAIDHLQEFRTALISAAVTGKIDVREEVS